jgi:hypothetical protein
MRSKIILLMGLVFVVLATTQCDKKKGESPEPESPTPIAPTTGINTVAEIIADNGSPVNTVTVDAQLASTITINGTIIEIPNNAFLTSTGGTVGGIATLQVKTILTKSQIIFSGAGANSSNSKLVATKGCIKATASQNTQSLRLNTGGGFFINVPDDLPSPPPLKKYYAPKITAVDSTAYWALGTDVADITQRTFTSSPTVYHKASLDTLLWLNVGVQFDSVAATKVPVTVNVDGTRFTKNNTMIFISFNNSLTVGALFEISNGVFRVSNMPQGKGVHIVAISVINGQYFAAVQSTTVSSTPINLTLNPVSQATMKSMVAALP